MSSFGWGERSGRRSLDVVVGCVRHQLHGISLGALPADAHVQLSDIARMARRHAVEPLVHSALAPNLDVTSPAAAALERGHLTAVGNHLRVLADLARLAPILDSVGASWAVVKGPVLAEAFYPRAELRSYNDLDVLVDPRQVGDVVEALEARGVRLLDVNWPLIRSSGRGEISLVLWQGTVLDLHWNLITERAARDAFRLNETEMLDRRRHVTVGSMSIPTLGRGDTLIHVALHALLAGGDRLGWFADVSAVMQGDGAMTASDWERAQGQRGSLAMAIILDRVQRVLKDANATVSLAAAPRALGWRRLVALSDRVRRPESLPRLLSMRILSGSTRGNTWTSAAAAGRSAWEGVGKPLLQRANPWSHSGPERDGTPNPLWIADGSAADRRDCFRDIASSTSRA